MGIFRRNKDDFKSLAKRRRATEDDAAWFEGDDDGAPLEVETGIGSNLQVDDVDEGG